MNLRPYQLRAIADVEALSLNGRRSIVIVSPTGSGKTEMFAALIKAHVAAGERALVLTHRVELVDQAWNRLNRFGVRAGVIQADHPRADAAAPVQVASVQTLQNRAKPVTDLVITDECHHCVSGQFSEIITAYPDALNLGFTATPYRLDGRGLGEIYGDIVVAAHPRELVELGYLVPPRIFSAPAPDLAGVRKSLGDYIVGELSAAMSVLTGRVVETWLKRGENRQTVLFAVDIRHSEELAARFREAGVPAEHFDANTTKAERAAKLERFRSRETRVLCNCNLISEGFDCPEIGCVVMARPTCSRCMYRQQCGRAVRPSDGKSDCIVLDHAGNFGRFGHPMDLEEYSLDSCVKPKNPNGDMPIKQCPGCFAIVAAGCSVCPECGEVFRSGRDVRETDIELVESTQIQSHYQRMSFDERLEVYEGFSAAAIARGYRSGWAAYQYRDRFGEWPAPEIKARAEAGTDEPARALARWITQGEASGYKVGWASWKFKNAYGRWPSPSVKARAEAIRHAS